MKIAIYGDSFSCGDVSSRHFHWYTLLAEMLDGETMTFGLGGSSLYYSYKKFTEYHKNYDLNIFCVTHFQKYPKSITIDGQIEWPSSIGAVEHLKEKHKNKISNYELKFLDNLYKWYMASSDEFMMNVQEVFLRKMENECSNLILIPCFSNSGSFTKERTEKYNIGPRGSMVDFVNAQNNFWNDDDGKIRWQEDITRTGCHYTPITNKVVAESIYRYIVNKEVFSAPVVIPQEHGREYYMKKIETESQ